MKEKTKGKYCFVIQASVLILYFIGHLTLNIFVAENHPSFFLHDDGSEYLNGAKTFAENGTVMAGPVRYYEAPRDHDIPEIYRPPLLSVMTGVVIYFVKNPMVSGAILQALAATLLVWSVFLTARYIGGTQLCGWTAAVLTTIHPLILTFSLRFSSELCFILFLSCLLFSYVKLSAVWKFMIMGLAAGCASGIRPTALLLLPAFGIYLLCCFSLKNVFLQPPYPSLRSMAKNYAVYVLFFILAVSPWMVRNYVNYGIWNPAGCLGGFNCFVGNNRDNANAYSVSDGESFLKHQQTGWNRALFLAKSFPENLSPVEQDQRFRKAAKKEILEMGGWQYLRMTLAKAWHFIRPWPLFGAHPVNVFWIVCVWEILLFSGGIGGIVILRKKTRFLLFLLMIFFVGWTAHSFVHLQMRHRIPFLDLPMILLSSAAVCHLAEFLRQKREKYRKKITR